MTVKAERTHARLNNHIGIFAFFAQVHPRCQHLLTQAAGNVFAMHELGIRCGHPLLSRQVRIVEIDAPARKWAEIDLRYGRIHGVADQQLLGRSETFGRTTAHG